MENFATINADISDVLNDITEYLDQTRRGIMIDMGSLPQKIVYLQGRVQSAPKEERQELSQFMAQVMQSLNILSDEIQKRYDSLSSDINALENHTDKE